MPESRLSRDWWAVRQSTLNSPASFTLCNYSRRCCSLGGWHSLGGGLAVGLIYGSIIALEPHRRVSETADSLVRLEIAALYLAPVAAASPQPTIQE